MLCTNVGRRHACEAEGSTAATHQASPAVSALSSSAAGSTGRGMSARVSLRGGGGGAQKSRHQALGADRNEQAIGGGGGGHWQAASSPVEGLQDQGGQGDPGHELGGRLDGAAGEAAGEGVSMPGALQGAWRLRSSLPAISMHAPRHLQSTPAPPAAGARPGRRRPLRGPGPPRSARWRPWDSVDCLGAAAAAQEARARQWRRRHSAGVAAAAKLPRLSLLSDSLSNSSHDAPRTAWSAHLRPTLPSSKS